LKSLGLWKTIYEAKQQVSLVVEGESVDLHQVNEEDTLAAEAAAPTGKDMVVVKHEESSLSCSPPDMENAGSLSPFEEGRRTSANSVSDRVRYVFPCYIYSIECLF
jgi:hypothetical protein